MTLDWAMGPDAGLPAPDLVIFIKSDPVVNASRAGYGDEKYENVKFQTSVAIQFEQIGEKCKDYWVDVDGN